MARCGGGRQGWWEYRVDILEDLLPGELLHAAQEDDDEGLGRLEGDQTRESAHQRQDPPVVQHLAPRARSWYSAARRRGLSSPTAPRAEMAGEENRGTTRYGRSAQTADTWLIGVLRVWLVLPSSIHAFNRSLGPLTHSDSHSLGAEVSPHPVPCVPVWRARMFCQFAMGFAAVSLGIHSTRVCPSVALKQKR